MLVDHHPTLLIGLVVGMQLAGQLPQVLARVKQIDNLYCAGEMLIGNVPDPFGAIAEDDFLFRAAPPPFPGLQIEPLAKCVGPASFLPGNSSLSP
jgi:hypothetical protein